MAIMEPWPSFQDGTWVVIDSSARDAFALREHGVFKSTGTKAREWKSQHGSLEMTHKENRQVFEEVSAATMARRTNLLQFGGDEIITMFR
ncbi:MAG: hypothetical protein M1816_002457 [Peltula sp. TS41687]|nr:MAG: hypothetical protein M1816_002457 [Peltula sp. TS41687]